MLVLPPFFFVSVEAEKYVGTGQPGPAGNLMKMIMARDELKREAREKKGRKRKQGVMRTDTTETRVPSPRWQKNRNDGKTVETIGDDVVSSV
jgi:hypothetical protein